MTRLLLCFLLFVCNSSYSREEPEYSKIYTPDEYYYLSSKIPKEVRQLIMNVNMAAPPHRQIQERARTEVRAFCLYVTRPE
ncbi:hypothetical protein A5606_002346 [Salmonella enterica subsp. enterica serovar Oakland]|nr:hypothetical protein [Salmonella enterica subsp. enterica serovar Oakland]